MLYACEFYFATENTPYKILAECLDAFLLLQPKNPELEPDN